MGFRFRFPVCVSAQLSAEKEFRWYFNLLFPSLEIDLWEARDAEGLEAAEREAQLEQLGTRIFNGISECSHRPRDSASRQLQLALRSADRDGDGCVTAPPAAAESDSWC